MAQTIVGLEITEEEVRAAEATTGKKPKIVAHGTVRLPSGAAKDSEVLNREAVVAALQELWKKAGFKSKRVVLGIVSRRVLVRDYRMQAMAPDLLARALPFQVADLLPVPADQAVIDFYPVSQEGEQLSGLLVAAVADTVTELVHTLTDAKLTVETVDLAPFGLLRAISQLTDAAETVAVVHLGLHTSYVVVSVQGVPRFVRIIPLELSATPEDAEFEGGGELDGEQFGELQGDLEQTDTTQLEETAADPDGEAGGAERLFQEPGPLRMTQVRIDDLVAQITNTLRFHLDRSEHSGIDQLLITGTGAGIPGVYDAFKARMSVPVRLVGGHHLAQAERQSRHGQEDLELLTPAGLTMMGAR